MRWVCSLFSRCSSLSLALACVLEMRLHCSTCSCCSSVSFALVCEWEMLLACSLCSRCSSVLFPLACEWRIGRSIVSFVGTFLFHSPFKRKEKFGSFYLLWHLASYLLALFVACLIRFRFRTTFLLSTRSNFFVHCLFCLKLSCLAL